MQKLFIALAAVFAFIIASSCYAQSHDSFWGNVGSTDTRIFRQYVNVSSSILKRIVTKEVSFPSKGYRNDRLITAIRASDQESNGKGGHAAIKSGGIKSTRAIVRFESQRGYGINFLLEIYVG